MTGRLGDHATVSSPVGPAPSPFDPMVTAQLVLYMSESAEVFKLSQLQSLYKKKLGELARPCPNLNPTRFKEHLLNNLPDGWHSFSRGI